EFGSHPAEVLRAPRVDQDQNPQLGAGHGVLHLDDGARGNTKQYVGGRHDRFHLPVGGWWIVTGDGELAHSFQYPLDHCSGTKIAPTHIVAGSPGRTVRIRGMKNNLRHAPVEKLLGVDRLIQNVETGRFERSLSGLTAIGALVTAAEIYFEH